MPSSQPLLYVLANFFCEATRFDASYSHLFLKITFSSISAGMDCKMDSEAIENRVNQAGEGLGGSNARRKNAVNWRFTPHLRLKFSFISQVLPT